MAKTSITDVVVPDVFNPYVVERTAELSALYQSGIIENDPAFDTLASSGGNLLNMPFWQDLDGADEVLSDSSDLTLNAITGETDVAVLLTRAKAWGVNDLAKALSGDDPMRVIGDLVAAYWARRMQATLISILEGAFGASNMSGNVHDVSEETGDNEFISAKTFVDAMQKLGDNKNRLTGVMMHSAVEAYLTKLQLIEYETTADKNDRVPFFLNKRVIVDDDLTATSDVYTTYLFGQGAIAYGNGAAPVPTETDRDSLGSDDILITRKHYILHPRGVKWNVATTRPTNTQLETGTNWSRVYEAKNIRIVQFKHKVGS